MWWTRDSLTNLVILHRTKERSTIFKSTIKVHHQEVKNKQFIIDIPKYAMKYSDALEY